jgi:ABC-type nitrate/sulfonate/bicarbonate transport system permease component
MSLLEAILIGAVVGLLLGIAIGAVRARRRGVD